MLSSAEISIFCNTQTGASGANKHVMLKITVFTFFSEV